METKGKSVFSVFEDIDVTDAQWEEVAVESRDWMLCHGVLMRTKGEGLLTHAPFTMLPCPYPRALFQQALDLAPLFNFLVHETSQDEEFIESVLSMTAKQDLFTQGLINVMRKASHSSLKKQKISLVITRSDYMVDAPDPQNPSLKQVEINCIAASFSNLSAITADGHKFLASRNEYLSSKLQNQRIPENTTRHKLPGAIAKAWELYGNPKAVVVMIVHGGETNVFDQRWLEFLLWDQYKIKMLRRTLEDFAERGSTNTTSNELFIDGQPVAIVYYRAGYSPDDYPTEKAWKGREIIECSYAIRCPTAALQLTGTKKMQQIRSDLTVLTKYIENHQKRYSSSTSQKSAAEIAKDISSCFAGLFSLNPGEKSTQETIEKVKANPELYVMKPQREGGGNNYFGKNIVELLQKLDPVQTSAYIMMERIFPPHFHTVFLREGKVHKVEAVAELGIYGIYVSDEKTVYVNEAGGFLLRSKSASIDDGGVAAGVAVLDAPYLVD